MDKSDDEIFCSALEFEDAEQQAAWLASTCRDDPKQARRIRKLLKAHRQVQNVNDNQPSILDRADQVFQAFAEDLELRPGTQLGAYQLVERIGEGGAGVVYRATQETPIQREVALKVLKAGMDSQRVLARFSLERQVLEQLDHPGITPILDAGVQPNGRPYFVMQLVRDAMTITRYCEEYELDLQQRIRLMISVCEVVQYAHQRGIIHRDLKPSNLLLEGAASDSPAPKVIDFGIAKIIRPKHEDTSAVTTQGERFGTPAYMSPEQALRFPGSIDIRSDVYSLGVILFELLAGSPPSERAHRDPTDDRWRKEDYWTAPVTPPSRQLAEARQHATQETLPPQSANTSPRNFRDGELPRELDWITLKALERDPGLRYQTVADLQRDLERFLVGEPVEAAGPSFPYRIKKFVARNRLATAAIALVLLTVVSTAIVTTYFGFAASRAEARARDQLANVLEMQAALTTERDNAQQARRQAEGLLRVFQVRTATDRALSEVYSSVVEIMKDPENADPEFLASLSNGIQSDFLIAPHDRLIIRGDWTWATEHYLEQVLDASIRFTSRHTAAVAANPTKVPATPPASPVPRRMPSEDREKKGVQLFRQQRRIDFQADLLREVRNVIGENTPFVAEILDNCGLLAIDRKAFVKATEYLSEAASIWEQTDEFPANVAQSRLFLAEACLLQDNREAAITELARARAMLDVVPSATPDLEALSAFHGELATRAAD